jgi:hypothetical protein
MGELRIVSEISIRRAHQRLASMAQLRRDEPLTAYPGEVPTLLQEALEVAARHGYDQANLARDLCWTARHVTEVLDAGDTRPSLRLVR